MLVPGWCLLLMLHRVPVQHMSSFIEVSSVFTSTAHPACSLALPSSGSESMNPASASAWSRLQSAGIEAVPAPGAIAHAGPGMLQAAVSSSNTSQLDSHARLQLPPVAPGRLPPGPACRQGQSTGRSRGWEACVWAASTAQPQC